MKKKLLNSMRVLLVAAGLCVGGNAWATEVPYNVGTSTDATYLSSYSDVWEMTGNGVLEVTFTNHNKTGVANWFNWHLICGNETDQPTDGDVNTNRYFVMRADRWDNVAGSAAGFWVSDNYFTDFMTYQNGATINLKIVRYGTTVNVYTTATKDAVEYTMGYVKTGISAEETIKFYLTGSNSYMEITAQSLSTDLAGETMTNAYMSFTDATISSKTIAGEVGSMTWSGQWTATPYIDTNTLRVGNMGDGTVTLVGEATGAKDVVTITFDLGIVQLSGKSLEFKVTDANDVVLVDEEFNQYAGTFTDSKNTFSFATSDFVSSKSDNPGLVTDNKNTFTITFNYATSKIQCSVVNKNGTVNKQVDMPESAAAVATFAVRSNYNNANRCCYFDNLKITTQIGNYAAASADYTVQFKSGETVVKTASVRTGDVGSTPTLDPTDYETVLADDYKYVYASDDASSTIIAAEGTVVTVNFTAYEKRTYTINAVDAGSNVLGELATGYVYADDTDITISTPWYVAYNGTLYNRNGNSADFDITSNGQVSTLEYTATETTNVVYYSEGESITGCTGTVTNGAASNRAIGRFANEITYTTLGAGSYTVYIRVHSGNNSGGTAIFKLGDVEFASKTFNKGNNQTFQTDFALTGSTDMKFHYDCGNATGLDYIYIVKNSDTPAISVTIASSGYSSLASIYGLDFSSVEGLTAYVATATTTETVTLTSVTELPANQGVILKGTADATYSIPVKAAAAYAGTNLLSAAVSATPIDANAAYILQGGLFHLVTAASTVPAGKAYLLASNVPSGARALAFTLDDETTGINSLTPSPSPMGEGSIYSVSGQRVKTMTKGLYIVNGKKVIIK